MREFWNKGIEEFMQLRNEGIVHVPFYKNPVNDLAPFRILEAQSVER